MMIDVNTWISSSMEIVFLFMYLSWQKPIRKISNNSIFLRHDRRERGPLIYCNNLRHFLIRLRFKSARFINIFWKMRWGKSKNNIKNKRIWQVHRHNDKFGRIIHNEYAEYKLQHNDLIRSTKQRYFIRQMVGTKNLQFKNKERLFSKTTYVFTLHITSNWSYDFN